jgi:hypothetical protein
MLGRSESMNFIVACNQIESCVIPAPKDKVWEKFLEFDLAKLFPSLISSIKFTQGGPCQINSFFEATYNDGSVWTYRISEVSDCKKSVVAYELVSSSVPLESTSMYQKIHLHTVTEDKTTFLVWETEYSNDVNSHVIQDGKFKKLDCFKDLKKLFS